MKIRPFGAELLHVVRRMAGRSDMTKLSYFFIILRTGLKILNSVHETLTIRRDEQTQRSNTDCGQNEVYV